MKIRLIFAGMMICSMFLTGAAGGYTGTDQGVLLEDRAAVQAQSLYDEESDFRRFAFIPLFLFGTALFAAGGFGRKMLSKKTEH